MELNALTIELAIIFLPGLIWARIDACYVLNSKPSDVEFLLRAFIFGLVSYSATFLVYLICGYDFTIVDLTTHTTINSETAYEILIAVIMSFVLSILWIYASTYKLLTRLLQKIQATKTYGDEDVWDFTFNSRDAAVEYVHFRDYDNKIVYAGWVNTFSKTEKLRELVLRDVEIFDFKGKLVYKIPLVYLSRSPENIHIDFPYRRRN